MLTISYITNDLIFTENFKNYRQAASYIQIFEKTKISGHKIL